MKKQWPVLVFIILLSSSFYGCAKKNINESSNLEPSQHGSYQVGVQETIWKDSNRRRSIKTSIWYPTSMASRSILYNNVFPGKARINAVVSPGKHPLIIISHGSGGNRYNQYYLSEFLASHGYIVAAVEHPHNNSSDNVDDIQITLGGFKIGGGFAITF